jgi:putative sigma-54 modulation protein
VQIVVTGRHGVSPDSKELAEAKIAKLEQVFDRFTSAHVTLDVTHGVSKAEASVHGPRGSVLVASAEDADMRAALDVLEDRLLRQARKLKTKIDGRRKGTGRGAA